MSTYTSILAGSRDVLCILYQENGSYIWRTQGVRVGEYFLCLTKKTERRQYYELLLIMSCFWNFDVFFHLNHDSMAPDFGSCPVFIYLFFMY